MRDASSESHQLFRTSKFYPYISTIQVLVKLDLTKWDAITQWGVITLWHQSTNSEFMGARILHIWDQSDKTGVCASIGRCKKFVISCIEKVLKSCFRIFGREFSSKYFRARIGVFISLWTCLFSDLMDIDRLPTV
jgi:hypothetical protein